MIEAEDFVENSGLFPKFQMPKKEKLESSQPLIQCFRNIRNQQKVLRNSISVILGVWVGFLFALMFSLTKLHRSAVRFL
jgi:hypothetical protein